MRNLEDVDLDTLRAFCRSVLMDDDSESEAKAEPGSTEQEQQRQEDENGTTPSEQPPYVFVGAGDTTWPASRGTSRREKSIGRRKEQSDA